LDCLPIRVIREERIMPLGKKRKLASKNSPIGLLATPSSAVSFHSRRINSNRIIVILGGGGVQRTILWISGLS
jgi:hypothetical protein